MAIDYEKDLFKCSKCEWIGKYAEKKVKQHSKTRYDNIVCPNCGTEEFYLVAQAILTFIETGKNRCRLEAKPLPNGSLKESGNSFPHVLMFCIGHIFNQDPLLLVHIADYLTENKDTKALYQLLQVGDSHAKPKK